MDHQQQKQQVKICIYLWLRKSFCDSSNPLFRSKFIPSLARLWYSQNATDDFELPSLSSLHSFLFGFIGTPKLQQISMYACGLDRQLRKKIRRTHTMFWFCKILLHRGKKCKAFYDWSADSLGCFQRYPKIFRFSPKILRKPHNYYGIPKVRNNPIWRLPGRK